MRRSVLTPILTLALAVAAGTAVAQVDTRRAQVQAAETDAVEALRRDVLAIRLNSDMTVADFLDRTDGHRTLDEVLGRATQIGGTRWIDDLTCIIRFELDGRRVADAMVDLARGAGAKSPVAAEALARQVEPWAGRTFSATGTSMAAQYVVEISPADANPAWRAVPEADGRSAVSAARGDAISRVFDSIRTIPLADGKTVGDALAVPAIRQAMQDWFAQRPVVGLEFGDDLEVRMTIAAPAQEIWGAFREALASQSEVPTPRTDADWARLRDEVLQRAARAVGRSYVPAANATATAPVAVARVVMPDRAPNWVYDPIDADGSATGPKRNLKTARLAEEDAERKLREQIYAFPLAAQETVGEAAKRDPRVEDAVSRSLFRARTYRVHWRDDGVTVRMTFDPQELWNELRAER